MPGIQNYSELAIGTPDGAPEGSTLTMPYSARAAHMHVLGRTRSGKSRFLADLIRQDIAKGCGVCVLDPHAELYEMTVNWLAQNSWLDRVQPRIHPIRLTDPATTFRYNPLHIEHPDEAYTVAANVTEAITRIYGGKDSSETPLFSFVLDITCTILALRGLPLAAAQHFLLNGTLDQEIRNRISDGVPDEYFRERGLELSRMAPKEFRETVGSTGRRLHEFLRNPMVKRIFSTTENTLSLSQIMEERHVLLIDASDQGDRLITKELKTIGSLLVNNLFSAARKRDPKANPTPFMLYIDEVQNYINNDIEDILSQAAKRGLYLTLAHQFLGQLKEQGDLIYNGVMSGTLIKAIFQITMEEAEILADEMFAGEIDFQRVKEKLTSPHVVGHEIAHLKSQSVSESRGTSSTNATGEASVESFGTSESQATGASESEVLSMASGLSTSATMTGADGEAVMLHSLGSSDSEASSQSKSESRMSGRSTAYGGASASSSSHTVGESESRSVSSGQSESLKPVIEWLSNTPYSLEEQRYELKRRLAYQPKRHAYLAVSREGVRGFVTRDVPDMLKIPLNEAALLEKLTVRSPWISVGADIPDPLSLPKVQALLTANPTPAETMLEPDDYFEEIE